MMIDALTTARGSDDGDGTEDRERDDLTEWV